MSREQPGGRLVLNHSTHIEGLIAILQKLVKQPGIKTVTPGVIGRAKGNMPKLNLRISVPTRGGFKVVARRGTSVQEVFIITPLDQIRLEQVIEQVLG